MTDAQNPNDMTNPAGPIRTGNVLSWATDLDDKTMEQAHRTADLAFVHKPLALMPDAHLGMGATVGSVVATEGSIIPAAVGVDIGCGMVAQKTVFTRDQVDGHLGALHAGIARSVPSGQPKRGKRHAGSHSPKRERSKVLDRLVRDAPDVKNDRFSPKKIATQFGTLGGGNHFVELTVDEDDRVWVVLHSGSRGPGNLFAQEHIGRARNEMKRVLEQPLDDPDLAHFVQGTPEFEAYINGMLWAQDYALENRAEMMAAVLQVLTHVMGRAGVVADVASGPDITDGAQIQCHHNYANCEQHHGVDMWVTRKGAIDASEGKWGIIPGSMATGSFIVSGRGNPAAYRSASHGAGRRLSRTAARKQLSEASLVAAMDGIAWNEDARGLLDEHPDAYKDIGEVMDNQQDLVRIEHRLETILNYKGA